MGEDSSQEHKHTATPLRLVLAAIAVAAGVALIVAPMSPHETAVVAGFGFIFTGIALLTQTSRDADFSPTITRLTRILASLIIVCGIVIALIPALGVTWVAFLIAAGLIAHGLFSVLHAFRREARRHHRAAEVIAAVAGIVFGVLAFTWPVLTLSVFRLAVGAWFVFFGIRLLIELIFRRGSKQARAATASADGSTPQPRTRRSRGVGATIGASLALAMSLLLAFGSQALLGGAPLPEPDAFYAAPADVPSEPGRLIRSEPLTTGVPAGAQAWKILYTTTNTDGTPAVSSGTVIAPADPGSEPLPLLSVAHGTTGVVAKCAPSLSATPFADGAGTTLEEMVTKHGWAAVTSDYIGLGTAGTHPYLVGDAEARNVLDASRAVQEFSEIRTTTDTVVWGHSQGGQGALWTGQIAADYAPELTIKGVAAFAPAADLFGLAEADKNEAAGKTVSAYIATTWNELYPELDLEEHLTPGSAGGVERIRDLCFNGKDVLGAILSGSQIPNQVFPNALLDGAFGDQLKAQEPTGPFPAPVMVAQGLADPLVKPALQQDWVTGRCDAGEAIDYRTFPGLSHNTLVAADSPLNPQLVQWTLDRWNGEPATPSCGASPVS